VRSLNALENHRTQVAFDDALVFKTFAFQLVNNFGALVYTAFIKDPHTCSEQNCMSEVRELLLVIFASRMGLNLFEISHPLKLRQRRKKRQKASKTSRLRRGVTRGLSSDEVRDLEAVSLDGSAAGALDRAELEQLDHDRRLALGDSIFDDYSEMTLQVSEPSWQGCRPRACVPHSHLLLLLLLQLVWLCDDVRGRIAHRAALGFHRESR
jgi:hypothetical protein